MIKYANSALLGIAQQTVAAGAQQTVAVGSGSAMINPLQGSSSKPFNHSATNIVGNSGTVLTNSVVLTGI